MDKYLFTDMPSDQIWEAAHFPMPFCSGEDDTVRLWSADHVVQGLLQSVEFNHQCFHGYRTKHDTDLLTAYWPAYLPLFAQLKSEFAKRRGKANCHQGHQTCAELKIGIHAPGMAKIGGYKALELKMGIHAPGMQAAGSAITNAQRYRCLVTGFISKPGPLTRYQRARGIDTSLRVRVYQPAADPILSLSL